MKTQKILVCNLTPRMGMLYYSSQFCNELKKTPGIDLKVAVASYYKGDIYEEDIDMIGIRTNPNFWSFILDTLNIPQHIWFLIKIYKFDPDIIHFIDNHPWYGMYSYVCKYSGITVYTTQHDVTLHSGESKTLTGKVAAYTNTILRSVSDKIMVHGDVLKKELVETYGVPKNKAISIPHGSYTFFNKYSKGLKVKKDSFLFFGRILDYKGLHTLLDSLQYIKKDFPDFRLTIAGPGDIQNYQDKIEKYKDYISVCNVEVEAEDAYNFFETTEFVVLPYDDATGSGVIPVAYCFKKPVIVTNVGELSSVVEEGKTGHIVPVKNPKKLAKAIVSMLQDKKTTKKMGANGYDFSLKELSWKPIVTKIYGKG